MPRTKKIIEEPVVENETQEILVPLLDTNEIVKLETEIPENTFVKPLKKFGVYFEGNFVKEVDENSDEINFYLDVNKKELDSRILIINTVVDDPNLLIYFHEGKQNRNYMSFEAFYNQNGLAPKTKTINSWAEYYRSFNSLLSDEEIALHKFGNLPYSFMIAESEE